MPRRIPERWIPYKPCGDVIEGTRIICFKVPLARNVQTDPAITKIWDIRTVLEDIPKLDAVIDLTNTDRYYDPRDFETAGVMHRKISMPGREIPPEHKVREFMDAVDEFLRIRCDSLVGVHCTHGLNRTGYMVCRYMRDRLNIPVEEAIKKFETARGYEIEREIYLARLLDKELPRPDFEAESMDRIRTHNSDIRRRRKRMKNQRKKLRRKNKMDEESQDKSQESRPEPQESRPKPLESRPQPQENRFNSQESRPQTQQSRPNLQESRPKPLESLPKPLESRPQTQQSRPNLQESRPEPQEIRAIWQESRPKPQGSRANWQESRPKPQGKRSKSPESGPRPKKKKIYNYQ